MEQMSRTILLVEDNPDDEKLTLRAFKRNNILNPIAVAHDGVEALDFLFARGEQAGRAGMAPPALIILDLNLPRLDGMGVLKAVREDERTRLIPVVVLTSSKEEQDLVQSYSLGANSYVRKPVDFTEFMEAARILGIFWLGLNQPPPERGPK
ncbi:MAG: response regulator receiver domain protein [Bradyrhizobium sp.]|nr:response regulator receiver domain protein [Bradyrhizobium sp.]